MKGTDQKKSVVTDQRTENSRGYRSENVGNHGYRSENVGNHGYRSENVGNHGYRSENVGNDGYRSEKARVQIGELRLLLIQIIERVGTDQRVCTD